MNLIPNFPAPAPLPDAPFLTRILFEQSGWPAAIVALLGLCAFLILNSRGDARALRVLGLGLLGAVALWGLGRLVVTDRERISRGTVDLVGAVAKADAARMTGLMAPEVAMVGRISTIPLDRDAIVTRATETTGKHYPLESWAVLEVQAHLTSDQRGQTMALVRVQPRDGGINFSWWLLDWKKTGDQWVVEKLEPLAIQGYLPLQGR